MFKKGKVKTFWWGLGLAIISAISFRADIFSFLFKVTGSSGWSYVIDQSTFIILGIILLLYFLRKRIISFNVVEAVRAHYPSILILGIVILIVHGSLVNTFFYAEDVTYDLKPVMQNVPIPRYMFGYQILPTIFSFLLFRTNVLPYNLLTLLFFSLAIFSIYWFVYVLSRKKTIAFFSSLFVATTPSFLNMFPWHGLAQGLPFVISLSVVSLIFLVYFRKGLNGAYYLLSLLFFAASIKDGFIRTAGFIPVYIFLLWFFNSKNLKSKLYLFLLSIPYILIWLSFFLFNFSFLGGSAKLGSFNINNYLIPIYYHVAALFVPASLAKQFFPFVISTVGHPFGLLVREPISAVFIIGCSASILLIFIALISLFRRKSTINWLILLSVLLIFTNIFYLPIFQTLPTNISSLDSIFAMTSPPYGPGSRYLFPSSIGVGLLLAIFLWWIDKKNKFLNALSKILLITIIYINGTISIQNHKNFIDGEMYPKKILVENIFSMVPRDGKPKLLFSSVDCRRQVGTRDWLYGFYLERELTYTDDLEEVKGLIDSGNYNKDNFYSFYCNPETNAFADISVPFRNILFSKKDIEADKKNPINFLSSDIKTREIAVGKNRDVFVLSRSVAISQEMNERIILPKTLTMNVAVSTAGVSFPFLDAVIKKDYKSLVPIDLWAEISKYGPLIANTENGIITSSTLGAFNYDIPKEDKLGIIDVVNQREKLRKGLTASVSDMNEDDNRITKDSLIDGVFIANAAPSGNDTFYIAKTTPTTIILKLPYSITLGRLLLNTPRSFMNDNLPAEATIFASLNNDYYQEVGSLNNITNNDKDQTIGKMIDIPLTPIIADSLKIIISKTNGGPVSFDEITIDDYNALAYTPEKIYNYYNQAFWYVSDQEILNKLLTINSYNTLNLAYACAEEQDWKKQKEDLSNLLPEVWKSEMIPIGNINIQTEVKTSLNCYGSVLRKIILIGPPFPSRLEVKNVSIN